MIQSSANQADPNLEVPTFTVCRNGRKVKLTFPQLFATAHRIWLRGDYHTAKAIFKQLQAVHDRGPRAHIFLAHCLVMEGDYAGCSSVLHRALPKDNFNDAARAYNTFIKQFPKNFIASLTKFTQRPYFEAAEGTEVAPKVQF